MDIALTNTILRVANANSQATTTQAVEVAVLKKALDVQAAAFSTLLYALPQSPSINLGALGTQLDTFA
jgi:hypothetical protein